MSDTNETTSAAAKAWATRRAAAENVKSIDPAALRNVSASTLRPGLLVSLKTSSSGNVSYSKKDLDADAPSTEGADVARWETVRVITDPKEHELAAKVRSRARALVTAVCANTAFGLLCPEIAEDQLERAVAEARRQVEEFNSTAELTRLSFYVIVGRIAANDVEATRAISSEVRDLLSDMETGVQNLDVKTIRDAASKARSIGAMLSPAAAARIQMAIDAARATATKIVRTGEQVAQEIDRRTVEMLKEARTAFLDIEPGNEVLQPAAAARALDLEPVAADAATVPASKPATPKFEI